MTNALSPIRFTYSNENYMLDLTQGSLLADEEQHNLRTLFHRKQGTLLRVNEQGLLVTMNWKERISYIWDPKEEQQKLRTVIDKTLKQLNCFIEKYHDQGTTLYAIRYLFNVKGACGIGRLNQALYNSSLVYGTNQLSRFLLPANTLRLSLGKDRCVDFVDPALNELSLQEGVISMDLGNDIANDNLWKLLCRQRGQKFQVKGDTGDQELQRQITEVITRINTYISLQKTVTKGHRLAINLIFSTHGPLCRLRRNLFNRGAIVEGSPLENILRPEMQSKKRGLVGALQKLRDDHQNEECKRRVEERLMDLVFEEYLLMQTLGIDLERNRDGGSGGARYARDRYGKGRKILVIKPADEGPYGVNNPQWYARVKRWIVSPKACLAGNSEPLAEFESYLCDRHFSIWSVPPTSIRYVTSADFVGNIHKECSVQMFVEGCTELGKYVGVSPVLHGLPRSYLRWYCGSETDLGVFSALSPRSVWNPHVQRDELVRDKIHRIVPQEPLEKVAKHNFLIEDVDCHLENILVKETPLAPDNSLLSRIFRGDQRVQDTEIEHFVDHFFKNNHAQELLNHLLSCSGEITTDQGEKKKVTLIKHDGGSSNPHSHPSSWDFLSLRFKHLFEILPPFEKAFSPQVADMSNTQKKLDAFLKEKAELQLRNILGLREVEEGSKKVMKHVFDIFWADENNRQLFYDYIFQNKPLLKKNSTPTDRAHFEKQKDVLADSLVKLMTALISASGVELRAIEKQEKYQHYFAYHLKRIRNNVRARRESYEVFVKRAAHEPMRSLLKDHCSKSDFEATLGVA
jgi:hypothetical protein